MVYELPSSFSGGIQGAVESLKKGVLPQATKPVVVPPATIITQEQKTFLPQKPKPVDPNKTPDVFKAKFVAKYPEGVAQDGRKYKDIPAVEIVAKIVRKYPNGVTSDGIPYTDFLPRPASPSDSLEYRLSQIESLYGGPKSQFFTDGKMRGQTEKEKQFTTDVVNRKNEGEIMKTIKAPYRGLESVGQNLAYGTFGAGADLLDLFGGDKLAGKMRKSVEQEKFKTGLTNQNKGLIGGLQSGELSSVIETLSSGAGYLATGEKIPLYLMTIAQGGNLSQEGEEQGQGGFLDKSIAYGTGTLSSVIERMSGQKVIGGLTKAGIKKETATTFVQRMNNYLKSLKPSDFEAGTEIIQQKIENIGRSLMGVDYDKGIQQYFEAGLLGKVLGKVGDKGFSESPITTLPPAAPKAPRVDAKNIETLKTIKVGKRANNNVIRNEERGFDPYTDIATHQEIVPSVDKTGLVRTTEQVQNLEDTLDPINDALTQSIKDEGVKISLDEFLLDSMNEAKQYENEGASYDRYVNQIKKDFEVYKRFTDEQGRIDLSKINEIKKAKYGISNFSDVESDKANKMVGKAAKELVEKYTTGESTKAINRELSRWYSARDLLLAMDGKTVKGGRLGKMAARVGGNIIGSYFGPLGSFAGGEISAAVQGQMMKGSLRKPSGTIDSESVLSKIPKRTTPQLPPPSGKPTSAKVVDVKPITGFLPGLLQKSESALSRQISSNNTEDKTTQSQLVRVLGGKRKKEVVLPKKESAGKKVNNPIIQKLAKKQETPKTPQVEANDFYKERLAINRKKLEDTNKRLQELNDSTDTTLQGQRNNFAEKRTLEIDKKILEDSIAGYEETLGKSPQVEGKTLEPLIKEAKKYDTLEDFVKAVKNDILDDGPLSKVINDYKKSGGKDVVLKDFYLNANKPKSLPLSQKSEVKYSEYNPPTKAKISNIFKKNGFTLSETRKGRRGTEYTGGVKIDVIKKDVKYGKDWVEEPTGKVKITSQKKYHVTGSQEVHSLDSVKEFLDKQGIKYIDNGESLKVDLLTIQSEVKYSKPIAPTVNELRNILKEGGLEQYKTEGLGKLGQMGTSGDFSVKDEVTTTFSRLGKGYKTHRKSTPTGYILIEKGNGMSLDKATLKKIKDILDERGVEYIADTSRIRIKKGDTKPSLPLSQKSEVKYSKPDTLVQEAKKYKSADDFVKAQIEKEEPVSMYRTSISGKKHEKIKDFTYFSPSKKHIEQYLRGGDTIIEYKLKPSELFQYTKDGMEYQYLPDSRNPNIQKLKDIYNKANKK